MILRRINECYEQLRRKEYLFCLIILLFVGSFLRFYALGSKGFRLDEIYRLNAVSSSLSWLFSYSAHLAQPPLFFLAARFIHYFSDNDGTLRLLGAICGVLTILYIYRFSALLFNETVGIISSFLLTVSVFHVWYSQDFGPYPLICLLSLVSVYYFLRVLTEGSRRDYYLFFITSFLATWTYVFTQVILGVEILFLLFLVICRRLFPFSFDGKIKIDKKKVLTLTLGIIIMMLAFAPYVHFMINHISFIGYTRQPFDYQNNVAHFVDYFLTHNKTNGFLWLFTQFGDYHGSCGKLYYIYWSGFLLGLVGLLKKERIQVVFILFFTIVLWFFSFSFFAITGKQESNHPIDTRNFIFILPFFLTTVALGVNYFTGILNFILNKGAWRRVVFPIVATLIVVPLFGYPNLRYLFTTYYKYEKQDAKGIAAYLEQNGKPGDILEVQSGLIERLMDRYMNKDFRRGLIQPPSLLNQLPQDRRFTYWYVGYTKGRAREPGEIVSLWAKQRRVIDEKAFPGLISSYVIYSTEYKVNPKRAKRIELTNSGFEDLKGNKVVGWNLGVWRGKARVDSDAVEYFSGRRSVRLTAETAGVHAGFAIKPIRVEPGRFYIIKAQLKYSREIKAAVQLNFLDEDKKKIRGYLIFPKPQSRDAWTEVVGFSYTPPGAHYCRIYLRILDSGKGEEFVLFDDIEFYMDTSMTYPP